MQENGMEFSRKKKVIFAVIISSVIAGFLFLTAFLNLASYNTSYHDTIADNSYTLLDSIVGKIEYALKYGKQLENYYGIDEIFDEMQKYCRIENYFIADTGSRILYGNEEPAEIAEKTEELKNSPSDYILWQNEGKQYILTKVVKDDQTAAYAGASYQLSGVNTGTERSIYLAVIVSSVLGILLFVLIFTRGNFQRILDKLLIIILSVVIVMNILFGAAAFRIFGNAYRDITDEVVDTFLVRIQYDVEKLISQGINYDEIYNIEEYFDSMVKNNVHIKEIFLSDTPESGELAKELVPDSSGRAMYLCARRSDSYTADKMKNLIINIAVAVIISVMMAVEILIFAVAVLTESRKRTRKPVPRDMEKSVQSVGIVRGLSFFFAAFRYMSVAFMAIVLAEIYRPVYVFGREIPYELLMSIPLSAQIFISMITSWLSGILITKFCWKPVALTGIAGMAAGTLCSAFAREPVSFILAQMVVGVGLGFAKTAFDVYAVAAASEKDMSLYTSSSNSSIIVGFSCSASIGALIASVFGYQGAYLVMTVLGIIVFAIIYIYGQNISGSTEEEDEISADVPKGFDFGFLRYILCVIIPYFFIMMFVDYFFPVYSSSKGLTTDVIGYVMLAYGISTSYIGASLCRKIPSGKMAAKVISLLMTLLACSIMLFSVKDMTIFAVLIVLLIGISDGIMPSMQFDYLYSLPLSHRLGFSKTLGIEGFFSSAIGGIAPIIFGFVMMNGNSGLFVISILVIICAVVFVVFDRTGRSGIHEK